jgi:hypothetical protein
MNMHLTINTRTEWGVSLFLLAMKEIKDSHISLQDSFNESHTDLMAYISICSAKNCKTCDILITNNSFSSNLTGRSFCTKTLKKLTRKSSNVVYGIEYNLYGLGALHMRFRE